LARSSKIYLPREVTEEATAVSQVDLMPPRMEPKPFCSLKTNLSVRDLTVMILRSKVTIRYRSAQRRGGGPPHEQTKAVIHLLVTDVVMPKMGGSQLAKLLAPLRPQMKVLYLSGYTDACRRAARQSCRRYGVLSKPFSPQVLARKVREVVGSISDQCRARNSGTEFRGSFVICAFGDVEFGDV